MSSIIPGQTIGILGGGQLGRMMAMEGRRMGYRVGVLDPQKNGPAAQVADFHIQSDFTNGQRVWEFVDQVDVVTIETELIPSKLLADLEAVQTTRPSHQILALIQDRLIQRQFLQEHGFPQTHFWAISDLESIEHTKEQGGFPTILKKRCSGYDGKGQVRVESADDLNEAWQELTAAPSILESVVPFSTELSIVLARGLNGEVCLYPLAENIHKKNILHATCVPAQVDKTVHTRAEELAVSLAETLNYCGIMAVEFFLLGNNTLLVNEIAPRPHNSGHFTLGACATSQFEQHLRAICGLPLGDPSLLHPVVMINLLGDLWRNGAPRWDRLLSHPRVRLHLYGKDHPQPGRKMGHFLWLADQNSDALYQANALLQKLSQNTCTEPHLVTEN